MMRKRPTGSLSTWVSRGMLDHIRSGHWPVGSELPSERDLREEFGVSRVPLREALAGLRALGVIETRAGSCTRVRRVDIDTVAQLLPLLVTLEGQRTFDQVFELRLSIESRTAYLAAQRRTDEQAQGLRKLVDKFRADQEAGLDESIETDLAFHVLIAESTQNRLFGVLMQTLAELVKHVQVESCKDDPVRRRRALQSHESIAEAILARDPERARVEMEAHLRYSATRSLQTGAATTPLQGGHR